ncbi:MAG TPA: molybdopterin converting factor subunit 1 [Stellaceae bacterium]
MKLLYFAWLRAKIGKAEESVELPAGVTNVAALLDWLRSRGPSFAEALSDNRIVRVAVNQHYVGRDHPVKPGDEVALFPPVTGG